MMGLVWNCRGLNNTLAPTIPKIRALLDSKYYDFLFLIETKCNANKVFPMFRSLGFVKCFGVDAVGASGGLWVGWKKEAKMTLVRACSNFIVLLVKKYDGLFWYLVLFYGAPELNLRSSVLNELDAWIESCTHPYLIIGDFNQVDCFLDKWSCNQNLIRGANEFVSWKIRNELIDIPFKGPRYTWCNNRKGDQRIYERLDKALGSKDWLMHFPNTGIKHYPLQLSDHAPIELDLQLTGSGGKRPYKMDAWVLDHEECLNGIRVAWNQVVVGSPAFIVVRKLARVRTTAKKWALDKKGEWRKVWDDFDKKLEDGMNLDVSGGG
ncbi:uncharacterized protein LOC141613274 [Silene latifolia]|uniref:uncharacterized protein LOC141613274 n=1 Tax=Silene latifolia TaxID=37657 RepID=UPI003D788AD5